MAATLLDGNALLETVKDDLRARIEALLRAHDQGSTFLPSPAEEFRAGFADPASEAPGDLAGQVAHPFFCAAEHR